jgi:hypothetical protein
MRGYKHILILVFIVITSFSVSSQSISYVGQIGQNQKKYEKIVASHQMQLLEVCDNNLDSAYQIWIDVMTSLEDYSESVNFDLKGVKMWMHIFVQDGKIKELYFHPKLNSRNMDFSKVNTLLEKFIQTYEFPIKSTVKFNHYGSASFPVFSIRYQDFEK